jgi:hypothetical protein
MSSPFFTKRISARCISNWEHLDLNSYKFSVPMDLPRMEINISKLD